MDTEFLIEFRGDVILTTEDIWPDGDAPENPNAEDVRRVMRGSGSKMYVLSDWNLLDDLHVTVDESEVWECPGPTRKGVTSDERARVPGRRR